MIRWGGPDARCYGDYIILYGILILLGYENIRFNEMFTSEGDIFTSKQEVESMIKRYKK